MKISEDAAPLEIATFHTSVGSLPVNLDSADLNGDGLEDLIIANAGSQTLTVLFSETDVNGDSTFNIHGTYAFTN